MSLLEERHCFIWLMALRRTLECVPGPMYQYVTKGQNVSIGYLKQLTRK